MARYWRIYRTFFVSSFARELEFRANFFAKILQNLMWIGFFLLILLVIYRNTNNVAGWSRGDAFVLAATVFLMNAIVSALFMALQEIPEHVRKGTLDFIITKPIDTQFWISTRKFNFDQVGNLLVGMAMVGVGVYLSGVHPSFVAWMAYVVLVFCSIAIFYAFNLMLMTTGIWLVRVDNLWVLGESVQQVARYPIDIFPGGVRMFFVYVVPLAFIATMPARQIVRGFDPAGMLLGIAWALVFGVMARGFWRFALRHYASASS